MGGCATWDLLLRDDEYLFAAAMPMCGIGDPTLAENASKTQIRMYHCKNESDHYLRCGKGNVRSDGSVWKC